MSEVAVRSTDGDEPPGRPGQGSPSDGAESCHAKPGHEASERDQQYRAIFEASSDGLVITDLDTELVLEANPAFCRMHGYDNMAGMHPTLFIHPDSHGLFGDYLQTVRNGQEFRGQAQDIRRDGTLFDVEVIGRTFIYRGKPAVLGLVRDVTEQLRAYQLLEERVAERTREIERRREVAEGLRELLAAVNSCETLDDVLNYVVAQSRRLLGSDASAIFLPDRERFDETLHIHASSGLEEQHAQVTLPLRMSSMGLAFVRQQPVVIFDIPAALPRTSGSPQEMELAEGQDFIRVTRLPSSLDEPGDPERGDQLPPLRTFANAYGALLAVPLVVKGEAYGTLALFFRGARGFNADDVALTGVFADQAALAIENARLRVQAEQAAVLEERQRLARDLHDAVTQTLFSASLIADILPELLDTDREDAHRRLDQLRGLTRGALAEMRLLLLELRPEAMSDIPLPQLVRQLGDAAAAATGARVDVEIDGASAINLPPDVHTSLYRIAQEALNNVVKHARATRVNIKVTVIGSGGVALAVLDDGSGLDPKTIPAGHWGLAIMRERADAIGAQFRLASRLGYGTRVEVEWPGSESEAR